MRLTLIDDQHGRDPDGALWAKGKGGTQWGRVSAISAWRRTQLMDDLERYYEINGHDPPAPSDHPLAWQWEYRGSRDDLDRLGSATGEKSG